MIRLVGLGEVDAIWPHIAEGMAACCRKSGGDITPDWLFMSSRRGDALLYAIERPEEGLLGALIGIPQVWANERVLRVVGFCGAGMETWLEELLFDKVQLSSIGISKCVFDGRAGLLPHLQELVGKDRVRVVRQVYELEIGNAP